MFTCDLIPCLPSSGSGLLSVAATSLLDNKTIHLRQREGEKERERDVFMGINVLIDLIVWDESIDSSVYLFLFLSKHLFFFLFLPKLRKSPAPHRLLEDIKLLITTLV